MKKFISILLILTLSISIFSFNASAAQNESSLGIDISKYTDSELDLTQYTMEDILSMSPEEYSELIREFERVYDPYGAYETSNSPYGASLQWTSGKEDNGEWIESGCHEYISAIAYTILTNDKGTFYDSHPAAKIAALILISYSSLLPDRVFAEYYVGPYAGHFYNPNTQKNFMYSKSNTARTNAVKHYEAAVEASKKGKPVEDVYKELGMCLHYVQDACEPHHAANIKNLPLINTSHGDFENHAFNIMEDCLGYYTSISGNYYTTASSNSVSDLTHQAAIKAYLYAENVNDSSATTHWDVIAGICLHNAADYSAMVLYKFGKEPSVPFYPN